MKTNKYLVGALVSACSLSGMAFAQDDPAVAYLDNMNARLAELGIEIEVHSMELLGSGEGMNMGRTVIASHHGNKQLGHDWAINDLFRNSRTNITYMIDAVDVTADIPASDQTDVVRFGIETWDEQQCASIGIDELAAAAPDLGFVQLLEGFGGSDITVGALLGQVDVVHGGFLPAAFFEAIGGPGGGAGILGATFTFTWTGTDWDGNGKADAAIREMYYNDGFTWVDDGILGERGDGVFDFATVALHESGHSLSRAHFGDVAFHHKKGLTTSPAAVMNAIYGGVKRSLNGPDVGGHCSDWSAWPTQNN